jgi:hypothetical protein
VLVPAPSVCPHCGGRVKARTDLLPREHPQEDWIEGRKLAVCHRHQPGRCTNRKCRRWVQQLGPGELPRAMIGPSFWAASLFLQYDIGLLTRKVVRTVVGLAEFLFVPGPECDATCPLPIDPRI